MSLVKIGAERVINERIFLKIRPKYVWRYIYIYTSRCTWMQSNREGENTRQGVRGTHSNGRVIRDGSIPPSMLECISVLFFFLSLWGLKARSYVQCTWIEKTWTGRGGTPVNDTGFNRTKWKGTRSMEISHRYFRVFVSVPISLVTSCRYEFHCHRIILLIEHYV